MAKLNEIQLGTEEYDWDTVNKVLVTNLGGIGTSSGRVSEAFQHLREAKLYSHEKNYEIMKSHIHQAIAQERESLRWLEQQLEDPRLIFVEPDEWPPDTKE